MKKIIIKEPIWKDRSVGLNVKDLSLTENVEVEIDYKDSMGKRVFPDSYTMKVENIIKYPTQRLRGNITVHLVPIKDLEDEV